MKESTKLSATYKSNDTEEWLDIYFTRPLGYLWARFFNAFNVHPNVVTILSIILGIAAAVMFYFDDIIARVSISREEGQGPGLRLQRGCWLRL